MTKPGPTVNILQGIKDKVGSAMGVGYAMAQISGAKFLRRLKTFRSPR